MSVSEQEQDKKKVHLPKKSFTAEFWVGIFALIGCVSFAYLSINLAGMKITNAGYYMVEAEFANIAGLKVGAPVEIAGVRIGEVSDISLDGTYALLTMQIRNRVKLRDDDIAQIRTKGIIGDKYIKISPGGSPEIVEAGGELSETESAVEFEDILGKIIHKLDGE